jgi:hypothetical protein
MCLHNLFINLLKPVDENAIAMLRMLQDLYTVFELHSKHNDKERLQVLCATLRDSQFRSCYRLQCCSCGSYLSVVPEEVRRGFESNQSNNRVSHDGGKAPVL